MLHTPPSNSLPQALLDPDTVVVPKQISSRAYLRGGVQIQRDAVMDDLGSSVPEVSVEFFLRYTAPLVNNIVCTSLRQLTSEILLVCNGFEEHQKRIVQSESETELNK